MRIAIVTRNGRCIGGIETYLSWAGRELGAAGHEVALLHEVDVPLDRNAVMIVDGMPRWCVGDVGADRGVDLLRQWAPDVIYAHGISDTGIEDAMLPIAPVVFHAHMYHGLCISGQRMFQTPRPRPCHRRFGASCLALYYPRRCGGWHPGTMWRDYWRQRRRRQFLEKCSTIVTNSRYLAAEYAKQIISARRIVALPFPGGALGNLGWVPAHNAGERLRKEWRLLFLGRMDRLKGGEMFLKTLPIVAGAAQRPIRVTLAGEGPEIERWKMLARDLQAETAGLTVAFVGWAEGRMREDLFRRSDLLVVPSVGPETFGMVGLEAARFGVPAAAFAVGGIPEWLEDGVVGRLASGDPPTVGGLAAAIVDCLRDVTTYRRLSAGAHANAVRFTLTAHTRELCDILAEAVQWSHRPVASV